MVMEKMHADERVHGFQMTEIAINFHLAGLRVALYACVAACKGVGLPTRPLQTLQKECVKKLSELKLGGTE